MFSGKLRSMRWGALAMVLFSACPPPPSGRLSDGGSGGPCLEPFPDALDFGEIESFTQTSSRVHLANRSNRFLVTSFRQLELPFKVSAVGSTRLGPAENLVLDVQFQPLDGRLHLAELEVDAGPGCAITLAVRGLGSGSVQALPESLDFGSVAPGQSKTLPLTVTNSRRVPVAIEGISIEGGSPFSFSGLSRVDLPAQGSVVFSVTVNPTEYGFAFARLLGLTATGQLSVPLSVTGGAPVAQVTPTAIDVPVVALFPGSLPPSSWEREVIVRNVANDAGANFSDLRVSSLVVERVDGGDAGELQVEVDPALRLGIRAGSEAPLLVKMVPAALGPREFRLTVITNDPAQPERVVTIATTAVTAPVCHFEVDSAAVQLMPGAFGFSTGALTFRNIGFTNCTFDDLRLLRGSNPAIRIAGGEANQVVVMPGLDYVVSFEGPMGGGTGAVFTYQVFNLDSRRQYVPVTAPP